MIQFKTVELAHFYFAVSEFGRPLHKLSKVDRLGIILKQGVTKLRMNTEGGGGGGGAQQELDLLFLVDSSASVGAENFYNEIKFIKKVIYFVLKHFLQEDEKRDHLWLWLTLTNDLTRSKIWRKQNGFFLLFFSLVL